MRKALALASCLSLSSLLSAACGDATPPPEAPVNAAAVAKASPTPAMTATSTPLPAASPAAAEYQQALALAKSGKLKESTSHFDRALELDPHMLLAAFDGAGAYEETGDKDAALEHHKKAIAIEPRFAEAHLELGTLLLLHKHDSAASVPEFRAAILEREPYVDPRFPYARTRGTALRNAAVAYAEMGQPGVGAGIARATIATVGPEAALSTLASQADEDVAKASVRSPATQADFVRANDLLHKKKDGKGALAIYDKLAKKKGLSALDQWDLHEGRALALVAQNDFAKARDAFEAAAKASRGLTWRQYVESVFNVACAESEVGHLPAALTAVEEVLWIEKIAGADPTVKAASFTSKLPTDSSLFKVRATPEFAALVARYR